MEWRLRSGDGDPASVAHGLTSRYDHCLTSLPAGRRSKRATETATLTDPNGRDFSQVPARPGPARGRDRAAAVPASARSKTGDGCAAAACSHLLFTPALPLFYT